MTERQERSIRAALEKVFRHYTRAGAANKDRRTHDFVFHMTDWYSDLMRLAALYRQPDAFEQDEWDDAVFGFLVHATGHLMAAAELSDTLLDPFDVSSRAVRRTKRKTTRKRAALNT